MISHHNYIKAKQYFKIMFKCNFYDTVIFRIRLYSEVKFNIKLTIAYSLLTKLNLIQLLHLTCEERMDSTTLYPGNL